MRSAAAFQGRLSLVEKYRILGASSLVIEGLVDSLYPLSIPLLGIVLALYN